MLSIFSKLKSLFSWKFREQISNDLIVDFKIAKFDLKLNFRFLTLNHRKQVAKNQDHYPW